MSLEYIRARKLRELQHILAYPSDNDLANAIENNVIGHNSFGIIERISRSQKISFA